MNDRTQPTGTTPMDVASDPTPRQRMRRLRKHLLPLQSESISPIDLPSSFSFPSGHPTTGIAVFGLLGLYGAILARTRGWKVAAVVAGLALGALIGVSRIVLNVHFVGDVLAGFCLGLSWLVACLLVSDMIRR